MTIVTNLSTGKRQEYTCPPVQAVVSAYEQSRGNFNTWTYDFSQAVPTKSGRFVFCDGFAATAPKFTPSMHEVTLYNRQSDEQPISFIFKAANGAEALRYALDNYPAAEYRIADIKRL